MPPVVVTVAVEGDTDAAVARRILDHLGLETGPIHGGRGKRWLDQQLPGYNHAADYSWWLVLRDLDRDAECAPELRDSLLPSRGTKMCFRVACRTVEAWLLADRESIAKYLAVSKTSIPRQPEELDDPKLDLVNLARHSRRRAIREDIVPAPGTSSRVGPGYTSRIIEFAGDFWRPEVAAAHSDSLQRCLDALAKIAE